MPKAQMTLTKPWDFEAWFMDLKSKGLDMAEAQARILFDSFLDFAEQSVKLSSSKWDDLFLIGLPQIREEGYKAIDKINGKAG
jgi:hypothetical protein